MNSIASALAAALALVAGVAHAASDIDWTKVDEAFGRAGAVQAAGVHRYAFPRSDLEVTVDGVRIRPGFALGSWVAMLPMGGEVMAMGDLVLTGTELNPVMKRLVDDGFEISAIHNHVLRASTPVWYMHIGAHGAPDRLARSLKAALALSATPLAAPAAAAAPPPIDFDTAAVDAALGAKGTNNGGVYQFSVARAETIREGGMELPPSMGTAIALNFQPTGGGRAAITGDFVLVGTEVSKVLKSLRDQGIEVTALHSHMVDETPRLYFMHFWANDDAQKLAKALRAALDLTNSKKGG
ncbi:MAG: DUF1259 domain-containing protein [Proteobacteria bacterium]|nr:MAG: DUF1259 domain-containing protein [Pseudomonadota bacterium]